MSFVMALIAGSVFGAGLLLSGMADPAKVLNFLDVAGHWDPSLAFVMAGAIAVTLPGYRWLRGRDAPWFSATFQWPNRHDIDRRLVGGALLFGVGWGLGGLCPGPAIVSLPLLAPGALVFFVCMVAGIALARRFT